MPKRKRVNVDADSDKDYDEPKPPLMRQKSTDSSRLACPFYVRYPDNFSLAKSCIGPGYDTISRLKEHLYRCHAPVRTISCPRCQTRFDDEKSMNSHLKEMTRCIIVERDQQDTMMEGMSDDAMRLLRSRKGNKHNSKEERWYDIWNKLFPDHWIPSSPYMESSSQRLEVDLIYEFGKFIIEALPCLLKEAVKYDQLTLTQRLHETVNDKVTGLVDEYLRKMPGSKPRREMIHQNQYTNRPESHCRTLYTTESKYSTSESTISEPSSIFSADSLTRACNSPQIIEEPDISLNKIYGRLEEQTPLFPIFNWDCFPELEGDFLYPRRSSVIQYGGGVTEGGTITPMTTISSASPLDDAGGIQFKDSM